MGAAKPSQESDSMRIALAQVNSTIGDFAGNARRMITMVEGLMGPKAPDLVVFPEMALCGYPPMDLLDQESFVEGCLEALRILQRGLPARVAVAAGFVDRNRGGSGKPLRNVLGVIRDGALVFTQAKTLLPTYDVFDEARYFEPADRRCIFNLDGTRIAFAICEDIWWESPPVPGMHYSVDPVKELLDAGADLLVVPSASPFQACKLAVRQRLAAKVSREGGIPTLYCNLVGANDSLVFDGRSFAIDAEGRLRAVAGWEEELLSIDMAELVAGAPGPRGTVPAQAGTGESETLGEIYNALVLGIRDYMRKCGFSKACLGLSGGLDSAVIAVLAADAIGADNLTCISMPSRFSSAGSVSDSVELCRNLGGPDGPGSRLESLPIEGPFAANLALLEPHFEGQPFGLAEENLQARIRGTLLMAWSNKFNSLLLTTGNKSELAAGYCTLYGDMNGAIAPIGDLFKTEVFALARHINARHVREGRIAPIPEAIISKPPSAELRPNQTDQDSLPPYETLDEILSLYIVENLALAEITARGFEESLVARIIGMVARSEYKRRQAPPVIKVSPRAFGTGRRIPIARCVHEANTRH
jgi:NAD+ synthase (glutamine-hydrolysing)